MKPSNKKILQKRKVSVQRNHEPLALRLIRIVLIRFLVQERIFRHQRWQCIRGVNCCLYLPPKSNLPITWKQQAELYHSPSPNSLCTFVKVLLPFWIEIIPFGEQLGKARLQVLTYLFDLERLLLDGLLCFSHCTTGIDQSHGLVGVTGSVTALGILV